MKEFEFLFGTQRCLIDVEARPTINSGPIYIATPIVVRDHAVQPFEGPPATGRRLEFTGDSESEALDRASAFLREEFGERANASPLPGARVRTYLAPLKASKGVRSTRQEGKPDGSSS